MTLKKQLTFFDVFCLASGAMISSGIFILPGIAYNHAGPAVILSYFLAGILAILGTLSVIELATALPKAGGDYFFITRSLGPLVGTVSGLLSWLAISLKTAFAVFGISEIIFILFGTPLYITTACLCILFTCLNIRGAKEATVFEVLLVSGLFLILMIFAVKCSMNIKPNYLRPFLPHGWNVVFATAGLIFVSFGGLINVASMSEEIDNPKRNIPLALLASVATITILYTVIVFITVGTLPGTVLAKSLTPIADSARHIMGNIGFLLITTASLLAFITTAIAGLMAASRYPMALSRDSLLPCFLARINHRYNTPVISISVTGLLIFLVLLLDISVLVKLASNVIIVSYILLNCSVIILRESKIRNYRPSFKVPLYPWLPLFNVVLLTFLIIDMGIASVEIAIGFVAAGILTYVFFGRKHEKKEYALIHFIERIVNKKLTTHVLETELREIIHDRDEIIKDRFDQIIKEAVLMDIERHVDKSAYFEIVAQKIGTAFGISPDSIAAALRDRENETSTAISSFVAVPHIIIEGEGKFKLFITRCVQGITFTDKYKSVKAIFVLVGTLDERQFHLQALAAIAQIVQNPDFEKRWLAADTVEHLRDIIMLGKRYRHS